MLGGNTKNNTLDTSRMSAHFLPVRWPRRNGPVRQAVSSEDYRPVPVMAGFPYGAFLPGRYSSVVIRAGPERQMETGSLNPVLLRGVGPVWARLVIRPKNAFITTMGALWVQIPSGQCRIQGTTEPAELRPAASGSIQDHQGKAYGKPLTAPKKGRDCNRVSLWDRKLGLTGFEDVSGLSTFQMLWRVGRRLAEPFRF